MQNSLKSRAGMDMDVPSEASMTVARIDEAGATEHPPERRTQGLSSLTALVKSGASGELISASSALEVHVHLQLGRVAWATDSRHAFVFTRHLQEQARVTKD